MLCWPCAFARSIACLAPRRRGRAERRGRSAHAVLRGAVLALAAACRSHMRASRHGALSWPPSASRSFRPAHGPRIAHHEHDRAMCAGSRRHPSTTQRRLRHGGAVMGKRRCGYGRFWRHSRICQSLSIQARSASVCWGTAAGLHRAAWELAIRCAAGELGASAGARAIKQRAAHILARRHASGERGDGAKATWQRAKHTLARCHATGERGAGAQGSWTCG
mmetsp:Transcript_35457/g.102382  ORF Transcript_35457/g.102382 Transcript_35457/m.102382 type:complete len:221 (+) Transcript_35457:820-1482(+)